MAIILDITGWKQTGAELAQIVNDECGYQNRRGIIGTLPDVIRMTPDQYEDQKAYYHVDPLFGSAELYRTTYNVMEIEVKHE